MPLLLCPGTHMLEPGLLCRMDASFAAMSICMSCVWLNLVASEVVSLLQTFGIIFNAPTVCRQAARSTSAPCASSHIPIVSNECSGCIGRWFSLCCSNCPLVLRACKIAACLVLSRQQPSVLLQAQRCGAMPCHAVLCRALLSCVMLANAVLFWAVWSRARSR